MIMKTERKFTWCVRYGNVKTGNVEYRMYYNWTTREINAFVADFVASHKDYIVRVFKGYKSF
nr:MAG TPA: hypothetical protein [Microviridae sp.]